MPLGDLVLGRLYLLIVLPFNSWRLGPFGFEIFFGVEWMTLPEVLWHHLAGRTAGDDVHAVLPHRV